MVRHGPAFDRAAEDVGNIVKLEHVNVTMPDQQLATVFYVSGLGLTRDPYLMTGIDNMWVNVGESQFHLPTGEPQVVRGCIGLVMPDLQALVARCATSPSQLAGTRFSFSSTATMSTPCPWGNRIRCHAPDAARFGPRTLGMPYVEFDVPAGSVAIAAFYREILDAPAEVSEQTAIVAAGARQSLRFRETDAPLPPYDGHHMQIYLADFSGPYQRLLARELVSSETDQHDTGSSTSSTLDDDAEFEVEHEVRSMRHPLFGRPLVNRNPAQTNRAYVPGRDAFA